MIQPPFGTSPSCAVPLAHCVSSEQSNVSGFARFPLFLSWVTVQGDMLVPPSGWAGSLHSPIP